MGNVWAKRRGKERGRKRGNVEVEKEVSADEYRPRRLTQETMTAPEPEKQGKILDRRYGKNHRTEFLVKWNDQDEPEYVDSKIMFSKYSEMVRTYFDDHIRYKNITYKD